MNFVAYRWRFSAKSGRRISRLGIGGRRDAGCFSFGSYPATRQSDEDPGHAAKAKPPVSLDIYWPWRRFSAGNGFGRFAATEPYLLADAKSNPGDFPEYPNVKQQWYYASKYGTEGAWKSIEKFFPKEGYYVDRANQQLALLYLKEGSYDSYDKAMDIFEKFTYRGDGDLELRAFGLAGQSVVLSYQGNYKESTRILVDEFLPISNNLNNPQMDRYVRGARRNGSKRDCPATEKE